VSKTLSFPSSKDILAACRQSDGAGAEKSSELLLSKLNLLLHALESEPTQKAAIANLHELAEKLSEEQFASLTIKTVSLPSLPAPIRLFLTPAVFSPELWGRTFAEGLLKSKEQFHGKRVVEVGTGSGWISLLLLFVTHVQEVLGLDLNPVAVTMAKLNAWLNGTTADGAYVLSLAGEPIVKVFQAEVSDLLGAPLASQRKFDHVIGCIPQVLHPNPVKLGRDNQQTGSAINQAQEVVQEEGLSEKDLYDLSNYCFEQGILEDRFGLPLIARALEQSQLCLEPGGRVTLVLGGRPGRQAIESMFDRRGFDTRLVWMRRIQQADDTDLASLVELEREYGIRFHFFMTRDSEQSISAATAVRLLAHGRLVYHDLLVYQADTRFEQEIFSFVRNLSQLGLESLRKELDFSRLADEQVSFISRLSSSLLKIKAIPYPHERGDKSLRETIARYLRGFCYYPIEADELFIAPSRPQLVDMVLRLAARKGDTVLLSSSLVDVYEKSVLGAQLDLVVGNDDLSELQELEDLVEPALVLIAPKQLQSPSPLTFKALCQKARSDPERIYIIDDSQGFDISSELGSNMTLRFAGQEPLPPNLVLLYGLIKNSISRDLELSFLINAPHIWLEGLDIGAELSYSRIAHPTQLLYEWLFNDLMTFPFPDQIQDNQRTHQKGTEVKAGLSELIQELAADPVFAPKPIDLETPGLLRLDYGEFEAPVPDILIKGLFKGFLDNENTFLPEIVSDRVCAYMKWTRKVTLSPNRVTLAQGVFALFGALIKTLTARLGRPCVVAVPDGSYGPLYPMLKYYGARVLPIKTQSERAFLLSQKDLASLSEKPDLLWLTQPNNPSGVFLDPERLRNIIEACHKQNIYVLSDEIFFLLSDHRLGKWTPASLSAGSYLNSPWASNIFMVDGIAKSFAAGGMRCGFMISPDESFAQEVASHVSAPPISMLRAWDALYSAFLEKSPHQMMDVSQAFSEVESYLNMQRKILSSRREELLALLRSKGLDDGYDTPYRGGLFLLAKLNDRYERLAREQSILTNPAQWGRTEDMVRMCICVTDEAFGEAMTRLRTFLES
jgi:aspartate/methionine/tyrosine aminotransferase/SAM-dependent methyltransferase